MRTEKFKDLFWFAPKSKIKAGDGLDKGRFPFYTSSPRLTKWIDKEQYFDEALIFGTGGFASVHFEDQPFSTSTDCIVAITTNNGIKTKFVYYYLFGNIHLLERGFKGAGLKHISKKYIENLEIPVLPIEIQNKIVAILDKAGSLINKREKSIQSLDELLRACFLDLFQDDLLNFRKSKTKLSNIASIVSGLTKGRKTKEIILREVPYLRVANAQDGFFNLKEIKNILATEREIVQYSISKGDLLITEGGDPDKLGRGAVWENEENTFIYQNHLFRLRINDLKEYSPYWLIQLLSSEFGKYYFLRQAKQTTGIATINKRQVSSFPIPSSSYLKQKEFEQHYLKIKASRNTLEKSLIEFNTLLNSIVQKVFNGTINFADNQNTEGSLNLLDDLSLDIDFELEVLIKEINLFEKSNDLSKIKGNPKYLKRLIDRLNNQEFKEKDLYDKAKHGAFQLMTSEEDQKVIQKYDQKSKSLKLALK